MQHTKKLLFLTHSLHFIITDTYISMVSYSHLICASGYYVAIVSGTVETDAPEAEIQPALDLLGDILDMFVSVSTIFEPVNQ